MIIKHNEEVKVSPHSYIYRWACPNNRSRYKNLGWVDCSKSEINSVMTSQIKGSFINGEPQFYMKKEVFS